MEQIITVDVGDGEGVHISKSKPEVIKKVYFPFFGFGAGAKGSCTLGYGEHLIDTYQSLSKTTWWFFWELLRHRNYETNTAKFRASSPTEQIKVNRGYKELFNLNFLVRIKRQHYMFNPQVIIPKLQNQESVMKQYKAHVKIAEGKNTLKERK